MRTISFALLVLCSCFGCEMSEAGPPPPPPDVVRYLGPVLKSAGKAARIYYLSTCIPVNEFGNTGPVPFPKLDVQPPSDGMTGISAIRDIFRNNNDVTVSEDKSGIIRIRIGEAPDSILNVHISNINLRIEQQYTALLAERAIEDSADVKMAEPKLGVRTLLRGISTAVRAPRNEAEIYNWPHISPSLSNMTVDQALDSVASTFGVAILYGACVKPSIYQIDLWFE